MPNSCSDIDTGKGSRTIAPFPASCYTVREIRAASAMTRLEAYFFKRSQQERDKEAIRAANSILKPRKIKACKPRISEHEPRKGTETEDTLEVDYQSFIISEHEPRKGTETKNTERIEDLIDYFRTRTPKGDGNNKSLYIGTPHFNNFRTRTPKGDGNLALRVA